MQNTQTLIFYEILNFITFKVIIRYENLIFKEIKIQKKSHSPSKKQDFIKDFSILFTITFYS